MADINIQNVHVPKNVILKQIPIYMCTWKNFLEISQNQSSYETNACLYNMPIYDNMYTDAAYITLSWYFVWRIYAWLLSIPKWNFHHLYYVKKKEKAL